MLDLAKDGFLARFRAGGRSRAEVAAIARDGPAEDTAESLRRGWQRMCLLVLYFQPFGALPASGCRVGVQTLAGLGPCSRSALFGPVCTREATVAALQ